MHWSQLKYFTQGRDGSIMVRTGSHYVGSFKASEAGKAKKALANFLKVKVQDLPRKDVKLKSVRKTSKYRYVYRNSTGTIYARVGTVYLGRFTTETLAAEAVARHQRKGKKKDIEGSSKKKSAHHEGPQKAKVRFQILKAIFRKWVPNDLTSSYILGKERCEAARGCTRSAVDVLHPLVRRRPFGERFSQGGRRLAVVSRLSWVALRIRPWWVSRSPSTPRVPSTASSEHGHEITSTSMSNCEIEEHEHWAKHVHVGVNYHSGWLPLLLRLRILKTVSGGKRTRMREIGWW